MQPHYIAATAATQSPSLYLDQFLSAFFPDDQEDVYFRFFPPRGASGLPQMFPTTRAEMTTPKMQARVQELNRTLGAYFVVNSGGNSDSDISRFNSFFCENDTLSIAEQRDQLIRSPLQPSLVVKTRKSLHAYWPIDGQCSAEEWRDIEERLIAYFKSDDKIKNPSRVMRLPGFDHIDGHGERVPVEVEQSGSQRYTVQQMRQAFPAVETTKEIYAPGDARLDSWDSLHAETRRRIMAHPTYSQRGEWGHCKGDCHSGQGNSAIAVNLPSGAYSCQAGCSSDQIRIAFGLPPFPEQHEASNADMTLSLSLDEISAMEFAEAERIVHTLERGEIGLICGGPNAGKSTLAMNLSLCLAAGRPFTPLCEGRQGGLRVMYVGDGQEMSLKKFRWNAQRMRESMNQEEQTLVGKNLRGLCGALIDGEPLNLANEAHMARVTEDIIEQKSEIVIIDTLTTCFVLQDENSNSEVQRRAMRPLGKLAAETGAAILVLHHPGKYSENAPQAIRAYRSRGASSIGAYVRLMLTLKRQDEKDAEWVDLICEKSKGDDFADVALRLDAAARWFTRTDLTPVRITSSYELVVEAVRSIGDAVRRSDLEKALEGKVRKSRVGEILAEALKVGDLLKSKHGSYIHPDYVEEEPVLPNTGPVFSDQVEVTVNA